MWRETLRATSINASQKDQKTNEAKNPNKSLSVKRSKKEQLSRTSLFSAINKEKKILINNLNRPGSIQFLKRRMLQNI